MMNDDQIANALASLALRVADGMRESSEQAAKRGASAPTALVFIFKNSGQSIHSLSKALALSHSATVRLVESLEHDGLIIKQQATDARAVALSCTAVGAKRAKNIIKARRNVVDKAIALLSPTEKKNLEVILRKLPLAKIEQDSTERSLTAESRTHGY